MSETNGGEADESPQLDKLAAALAKAQAAVAHADPSRTAKITKDGTAKRKYATLADVMDAGRAALAANGLAVVQHPSGGAGGLVLTTWLLHESGQWMRSRLSVPYAASQAMSETQALGSAITYCRRYAYSAICGVAVEDDDAESTKSGEEREDATEAAPPPTTFPPFGKGKGQPIAGAAVDELRWYEARMHESVADPEKARFKGKNEAMLRAIEAELARQRGATPEGKRETVAAPKAEPQVYEDAARLLKEAPSMERVSAVLRRAFDSGKLNADQRKALDVVADQRIAALKTPTADPGDEDHEARAANTDDAPF